MTSSSWCKKQNSQNSESFISTKVLQANCVYSLPIDDDVISDNSNIINPSVETSIMNPLTYQSFTVTSNTPVNPDTNLFICKSGLNPDAGPFFSQLTQKSRSISTHIGLNPNATPFIAGVTSNPNARPHFPCTALNPNAEMFSPACLLLLNDESYVDTLTNNSVLNVTPVVHDISTPVLNEFGLREQDIFNVFKSDASNSPILNSPSIPLQILNISTPSLMSNGNSSHRRVNYYENRFLGISKITTAYNNDSSFTSISDSGSPPVLNISTPIVSECGDISVNTLELGSLMGYSRQLLYFKLFCYMLFTCLYICMCTLPLDNGSSYGCSESIDISNISGSFLAENQTHSMVHSFLNSTIRSDIKPPLGSGDVKSDP